MSIENLINPDGSMRRIIRPPPPPYSQHPEQPFISVPIIMTQNSNHTRMANSNYSKVVVQQNVQHRYSIDTAVLHHSPTPTPPPPVLTPQPAPFPPPPAENLGALLPASNFCNEQDKEQECMAERLGDDAVSHYKALGEIISTVTKSLKDKEDKLKSSLQANCELSAQVDVKSEHIKDLEGRLKVLNNKVAEIKKKAAIEVQQSKSEENIWRNNYVTLNENATAIENESKEDKKTIEPLKMTVSESKEKIEKLQVELSNHKMSEKQANKDLEIKNKKIISLTKIVKGRDKQIREQEAKILDLQKSAKKLQEDFDNEQEEHKKKCERYSKLEVSYKKISRINREMKTENDKHAQKDKSSGAIIQNLKTQQNDLKILVKELEARDSKSTEENTRISQELENERKEKENKVAELEKKTEIIETLKSKVEDLEKEKAELPDKLTATMNQFWKSTLFQNQKNGTVSKSSSAENESLPQSSSSSTSSSSQPVENVKDSTDEQAVSGGQKRKSEEGKSDPEKKKRASIGHDQPQSKGSNTNAKILETSSSSRINTSPSTRGTQQQNKRDDKK